MYLSMFVEKEVQIPLMQKTQTKEYMCSSSISTMKM